jgi:hypothetical protein
VRARPIGIVGGHGAVGRVVARLLHLRGLGPLRIGGRHVEVARRFASPELSPAELMTVDVLDADSLARFCRGCRVVVNCAGPSYQILDRVARAALDVGAAYVDPGGDDPTFERLVTSSTRRVERAVVLSAGMMPGLSGLLPRWLAEQGFDRVTRLAAYVCTRDHLTRAGAVDYLLSLGGRFGESLAEWRHGARVSRALEPLSDLDLPFFPNRVTAHPFLSRETERVARALALEAARWYNVFEGGHMVVALGRLQGAMTGQADLAHAAAELSRAAELDLFGHAPYQLFVLHLDGTDAGGHCSRTLVLRATSVYVLTGAVAALAAELADGSIPAGVHYAADILPAERVVAELRRTPAVVTFEVHEDSAIDWWSPGDARVEEGVL